MAHLLADQFLVFGLSGRDDFPPEPPIFGDDPSGGVVPPRFPHNGNGTTKNPLEQRDVPVGPSCASGRHQVK